MPGWGSSAAQQAQAPPAEKSNEKTPANARAAAPVPIPLSDLAAQAEATSANLHEIETALAADDTPSTITAELPALTREIDARQSENARIVAQRPSLDLLRDLERDWETLHATLSMWTRELDEGTAKLNKVLARLAQDEQIWRETLKLARTADAPPELAQRVEALLAAIDATRTAPSKRERRKPCGCRAALPPKISESRRRWSPYGGRAAARWAACFSRIARPSGRRDSQAVPANSSRSTPRNPGPHS